jgi:hypothetical protein
MNSLQRRQVPVGSTIVDIRCGLVGTRKGTVYAKLVSPNGETLISATLEYICNQLQHAEFV